MKWILIGLVKLYRLTLSPLVGQHCKYLPTCSQYSLEALERFGAIKGTWLTIWRLFRCNPFSKGGIDEVPQTFKWNCWSRENQESKINSNFLKSKEEYSNHDGK
ncbi:MAG: membrane protein insertion efficiency factor YidD [Burkholderiales bacterium]|nr:membrane protein insertion efficiency factor YidD [Burkholderiales bacterium]